MKIKAYLKVSLDSLIFTLVSLVVCSFNDRKTCRCKNSIKVLDF